MYWRFNGNPGQVGFAHPRIGDIVEDDVTKTRWIKVGPGPLAFMRIEMIERRTARGEPDGYCDLNQHGLVPVARLGLGPEVHTALGVTERIYVAGQANATALAPAQLTANVIRAMPILRPHGSIVGKLSIAVTGAIAGSKARLGIYTSTGNGSLWPRDLLADAGEVGTGSTGVKTVFVGQLIPRGEFAWVALLTDAAITIRCMPVAGAYPVFGVDLQMGVAAGVGALATQTYGALPALFPTAGAAAISATPIPAIGVQFSA